MNARDQNGHTPLTVSARGNPEVVSVLLEHGASVKARLEGGLTPLILAVGAGSTENGTSSSTERCRSHYHGRRRPFRSQDRDSNGQRRNGGTAKEGLLEGVENFGNLRIKLRRSPRGTQFTNRRILTFRIKPKPTSVVIIDDPP